MSRTPAAEGARLRLAYPLWLIERTADGPREARAEGWRARRLGYTFEAGAPTTAALEIMINSFESDLVAQVRRANSLNGARAGGVRVP